MLEITVLGAADSIGKSCVMISDRDRRIILDAGLMLHPRRSGKLSTPPAGLDDYSYEIDSVLISHAHIDHSGYTPALYRAGYDGSVYMTKPTKDIVKVLWKDHLKIEGPHHYGIPHLQTAFNRIVTKEYKRKFQIANGISAEFLDASHILGSAGILVDWDGTRIFYTGDFNDAKTPFHDPIIFPDPDEPIDILITETTNANRKMDARKIVTSNLTKKLLKCYSRNGKAIIPSFSLGRAQEIQAYLTFDFDSFLHKFPLYIDGMILEMNKIYHEYMNEKWVSPRILFKLKEKGHKSPFEHNGIKTLDDVYYGGKKAKKREQLITQDKPVIILTTSGMLEGGPVYDYLRFGGDNSVNGLFIVGYQVDGTLGSDIISGERLISIDNGFGQSYDIKLELEVEKFPFSGHSSLEGLTQMVRYSSPSKVYAIHGDPSAQRYFSQNLDNAGFELNILTNHDILPEYP